VVGSPRRCPVFGQAMTGRKTSACSDKCHASLRRRRSAEAQAREMRRKLTVVKSCTFTWWQMGLLTLSLLSSGIFVGSIWPGVFVNAGAACSRCFLWCPPFT